jgi:hypothetical protein
VLVYKYFCVSFDFIVRIFLFYIDRYWKLASPGSKNLLEGLAGVLVYLNGAEAPESSAGSIVGVDWGSFYFYGASYVFSA